MRLGNPMALTIAPPVEGPERQEKINIYWECVLILHLSNRFTLTNKVTKSQLVPSLVY